MLEIARYQFTNFAVRRLDQAAAKPGQKSLNPHDQQHHSGARVSANPESRRQCHAQRNSTVIARLDRAIQ
jgi:hypothetical protein